MSDIKDEFAKIRGHIPFETAPGACARRAAAPSKRKQQYQAATSKCKQQDESGQREANVTRPAELSITAFQNNHGL